MIQHLLLLIALPIHFTIRPQFTANVWQNTPVESDTARVTELLRRSGNLAKTGHLNVARGPLDSALSLARRGGYKHVLGRVHCAKEFLAYREGKFEESVREGQIACGLLRATSHYQALALAMVIMGNSYGMTGDFKNAERYFKSSLAIAKKHQVLISEAQAYGGLVNIASKKEDYRLALQYNNQALAIYKRLGADSYYHFALISQADIYQQLKMYREAEQAYLHTMAYSQAKKDAVLLTYCHAGLPFVLAELNKLSQAESMTKLALNETRNAPNKVYLYKNLYNLLSMIQERRGDYRNALANKKLSAIYLDTLVNQQRIKELATAETRYRTAEKQRKIAELSVENKHQQRRLWALLAGTVALVGSLVAVGIFYRIIQRKNRQLVLVNKLIEERNERITQQAHKLTLLMRELHHRVKNNLAIVASLLRLQSNKLVDEHAVQAIQESRQRVEAMALIHQNLYLKDDSTMVNMHNYVHDMVNQLVRAYGYTSQTLQLVVNVDSMELEVDVAIPLGLILNELITNSFKHAFSTTPSPALTVSLRQSHDLPAVIMELEDNGPGVNADYQNTSSTTFGMRLVSALVQQLRGNLIAENRPGAYYYLRVETAA